MAFTTTTDIWALRAIKIISLACLFACAAPHVKAQTLLNGSFETNTGSCQYNISNAVFNANVSNVTAFGSASQLDIIRSTCGFGWAQDGAWFVAMAVDISNTLTDAFSITINAPLVSGNAYAISWYDRGWTPYATNILQIGLSTTSNTFGSLIYTSPMPTMDTWVARTVNFNAPNGGQYLTARVVAGAYGWTHVDNFVLTIPMPAAEHALTGLPLPDGSDQLLYTLSGLQEDASATLQFIGQDGNATQAATLQKTGAAGSEITIKRSESYPHHYRIKITDADGNEHLGQVLALGGSSAESATDWMVYPNPTSQEIHVLLPQDATGKVKLIDAAGRLILDKDASREMHFQTANLPKGIYQIVWIDGISSQTKTISVQ